MKQMKMETKQAKADRTHKAGTYTQLSSSLHQKERGENEGTAQRETRTIKTNRKREKHHLQVGDEACTLYQGSKQRTECISEHKGKSRGALEGCHASIAA